MFKKLIMLTLLAASPLLWADNLVEDNGMGMDRLELERLIETWDPGMRAEAAADPDVRRSFLEQALANKRLAAKVDAVKLEDDPGFYWKTRLALRNMKVKLYLEHYRKQIKVPDMSELAEEQYRANREKYAAVPEKRASSHILIKCLPGVCDRKKKRPIAEEVLRKLKAGESFEKLVEEYSGDEGTKGRKGSLDKWIRKGEPHIVPRYVGALFNIDKVGGYSGIVETRFGFHIIRLDGVQKAKFQTFDEVKDKIIGILEEQYRTLQMIELNKNYQFSDKARVDDKALDKLFADFQKNRFARAERKE